MRFFIWTAIYTTTIYCLAAITARELPPIPFVWSIAILVCGLMLIFSIGFPEEHPFQYERHEEELK